MTPYNKSSGLKSFREKAASFFKKNLLFFAAVILTLQIWWAIRNQFQISQTISFPVTVQTQNDEVPLGSPSPEKITVFLSGGKSILDNLSIQDVKLILNTSQAKRTEKDNEIVCNWTVKDSDINVPFGLRVKNFRTTEIKLSLDKIISKELPVEAVLDETKLPRGYKIGKVTVEPEKVSVRAASRKLGKLKNIRTIPIPLDNITHSFDCDQAFDSENYSDIDFSRKNVLVQVEILRAVKTRTFKTLPIRILIPAASRQHFMTCEIVSNPTVDLDVSGAENVINSLRREDIFIFANISEFQKSGLYQIDLRCAIDKNGVTAFKISPSQVDVKLERITKR